MVNDPGPIRELAEKLDDLTTAVAESSRFEDLRRNLRDELEAETRELSRPEGRHRHARTAR